MADNTILNPGVAGDLVRDIDRAGVKTQVMALDAGGQQGESLVSLANPLPTEEMSALNADQPIFVAVTGDPSGDFAGVNLLEQVMNDGSGLSFNVRTINPPRADVTGAAILSDAVPIPIVATLNQAIVIDTTGYQSLQITAQALQAAVTSSNDGVNWTALSGAPNLLGTLATTVFPNTSYIFPCLARYIRFVPSAAGIATVYLRNHPFPSGYTANTAVNITQYGTAGVVTGGVAGVFAVGGNIAVGGAPTSNPVMAGGIDTGGLTRRLLTDTSGRLNVGGFGVDLAGTVRQLGLTANSPAANLPSILVQETGQTEGQTPAELLLQILQEMRIANHQLYLLNTQGGSHPADDPGSFRNDPQFLM